MDVNFKLLNETNKLVKLMDLVADETLPQEIVGIVKKHSKLALYSSFLPGVGVVAGAASIWGMYIRINEKLGLPFRENAVKTIGSGVATNLAGYMIGSLIPVVGQATTYALTLASGYIYLKALCFLAEKKGPRFSADDLSKAIKEVMINQDLIKSFISSAKEIFSNDENCEEEYYDGSTEFVTLDREVVAFIVENVIRQELDGKFEDTISDNRYIWQLGADQIQIKCIKVSLENKFKIDFPEDFVNSSAVGQIIDFLVENGTLCDDEYDDDDGYDYDLEDEYDIDECECVVEENTKDYVSNYREICPGIVVARGYLSDCFRHGCNYYIESIIETLLRDPKSPEKVVLQINSDLGTNIFGWQVKDETREGALLKLQEVVLHKSVEISLSELHNLITLLPHGTLDESLKIKIFAVKSIMDNEFYVHGVVTAGTVSVGDTVVLQAEDGTVFEKKVKWIEMFEKSFPLAETGDLVGIGFMGSKPSFAQDVHLIKSVDSVKRGNDKNVGTAHVPEKQTTPQPSPTENEQEYLEELREILTDGDISPRERRLLEKIRTQLGISEARAQELEASLMNPSLSEEEQEYFDEYKEIISEGEISDRDRRFLEKLKKMNGISEERAKEIENMVK